MKKTAQKLQKQGRGGDTLLAHINPREAELLKLYGGSGTRNPQTGLLEFDDGWGGGDGGGGWGGGGFGGGGDGGDGSGFGGGGFGGDAGAGFGGGYGGGGGDFGAGAGSYGGFGGDSGGTFGDGMIGTGAVGDSVYGPGFADSAWDGSDFSPSIAPALSLDSMMGFGAMTGAANTTNDAVNSYSGEFASTDDSVLAKVLKNPFAQVALSALAKSNPAVATALSVAKAAMSPGDAFGGTVGSAIGSAFGPAGAVAGQYAGSRAGANAVAGRGDASAAGSSMGAQSGGGFGQNAMGLLGSLYAGHRADQSAKKQIGQLQGLYGADSPYAQMARQKMERRDAAAGRRSQYGVRETELAALLADKAAGMAPTLNTIYNQRDQNRADMLRSGLTYYDRLGGYEGIKKGAGDIYDTLSGWFNG